MAPFWNFFGAKYKLARRLGPPRRDQVIEPFAGSASFSVFHEPRQVTLVERDPVIAGIWDQAGLRDRCRHRVESVEPAG
jgi:hypothetical protein